MNPRLAAIASMLLLAAAVVLAVIVGIERFPSGVVVLACVAVALVAAWWALLHRGAARIVGVAAASGLLAGAVVLVVVEARVLEDALILAGLLLSLAAARRVFAVRAKLATAPPPRRPVLFYNPKSGGGKAERFHLAREARARGVEPIELHFGEDLVALVGETIDNGADAVGVAGGDGTQAIVAAIAADRGLPYICVPAGTRNHFALDLGVDRDDVVGALDAFTQGGERIVDLAEVNGRVFVNNVSLGVYAEAVQQGGYRNAKLRTIADTMPEMIGPGGKTLDLRWTGPDGRDHTTSAVMLVSNDPYRLGRVLGSGTRPRLDGRRARHHGPAGRRGRGWREAHAGVGRGVVRGQLRPAHRGRDRRRGRPARPAVGFPQPTSGAPRANRSPAPRSLPIGSDAREHPWAGSADIARVAIRGSL